jgi:serine/threonine protein kinase
VNKISPSLIEKDDDFMEIVSNISRLRHSNISELVGYCGEHGQCLFVHRYFNRGSLHDMLHNVDDVGKRKLTWSVRVKIALGIARALE